MLSPAARWWRPARRCPAARTLPAACCLKLKLKLKLKREPGCVLRLGNGEGRAMLHELQHDFNDEVPTTGAAHGVRLVERFPAA